MVELIPDVVPIHYWCQWVHYFPTVVVILLDIPGVGHIDLLECNTLSGVGQSNVDIGGNTKATNKVLGFLHSCRGQRPTM
jgi:hypothetical protein